MTTMAMLMPGTRMPELARPSITREEWLQSLVREIRPWYAGDNLPHTVHTSVSFPSSGMRGKAIGECWSASASADRCPQVFIHPKMDDAVQVATTVVHELVHACNPEGTAHGKGFKKIAVRLGLEGKMTATVAGEELVTRLGEVIARIGPYPHPRLAANPPRKIQTTRMLKLQCPVCDYTVRTTSKWIEMGFPSCPEGDVMVPAE